ncbi:lipoate--protein ligase family protein [Acerihabitans sp. TG2]|uniref:lipoyl protein ligase domain-containing protein n=1 Tax=Acerihabitans sp. TG2 TaxID=3096008 RepID=UPI002B22F7BD|nr:lipoate--protein ligase family protein [Acerihabitans sp. TG2]MEA9391194.1 lipoate--protein ligase family protein [Acerihabitans sp. TG2]
MKAVSPAAVERGLFTLPRGRLVFCPDPTQAEGDLFERAITGAAVAQLWHAPQSLVVPASYKRFAQLAQVSQQFADAGCPVFLRKSGGGLVPQGPGIINLSLAYPLARTLGDAAEGVYQQLCGLLIHALENLGVTTGLQAVAGSFCDGRFNLACGKGSAARKIAGTAQYWHAIPRQTDDGPRRHVVLAHAVLLVDCDLALAHRYANQFEAALGSGRDYQASKTVSVAQMLPASETEVWNKVIDALTEHITKERIFT